jgi:hypothetical protein
MLFALVAVVLEVQITLVVEVQVVVVVQVDFLQDGRGQQILAQSEQEVLVDHKVGLLAVVLFMAWYLLVEAVEVEDQEQLAVQVLMDLVLLEEEEQTPLVVVAQFLIQAHLMLMAVVLGLMEVLVTELVEEEDSIVLAIALLVVQVV